MKSKTKFAIPSKTKRYNKGDAWRRFLRRHTVPATNASNWKTASVWWSAHVI